MNVQVGEKQLEIKTLKKVSSSSLIYVFILPRFCFRNTSHKCTLTRFLLHIWDKSKTFNISFLSLFSCYYLCICLKYEATQRCNTQFNKTSCVKKVMIYYDNCRDFRQIRKNKVDSFRKKKIFGKFEKNLFVIQMRFFVDDRLKPLSMVKHWINLPPFSLVISFSSSISNKLQSN